MGRAVRPGDRGGSWSCCASAGAAALRRRTRPRTRRRSRRQRGAAAREVSVQDAELVRCHPGRPRPDGARARTGRGPHSWRAASCVRCLRARVRDVRPCRAGTHAAARSSSMTTATARSRWARPCPPPWLPRPSPGGRPAAWSRAGAYVLLPRRPERLHVLLDVVVRAVQRARHLREPELCGVLLTLGVPAGHGRRRRPLCSMTQARLTTLRPSTIRRTEPSSLITD